MEFWIRGNSEVIVLGDGKMELAISERRCKVSDTSEAARPCLLSAWDECNDEDAPVRSVLVVARGRRECASSLAPS